MNKVFYLKTPTVLDIREIFTLGLTTKKGDETKIGHKGSGLKFTLAYLHRLDSYMAISLPGGQYASNARQTEVRGTQHDFIELLHVQDKALPTERIETHITTEAGSDTWNQPWFVLRELIQNAVDEVGEFGVLDSPADYDGNGTLIIVPLVSELEQAWQERALWLHPKQDSVMYDCSATKAFYYHGFRVLDGTRQYKYCYDITTCIERENLSEDRQLRDKKIGELFVSIVQKCPCLPDSFYDHLVNSIESTGDSWHNSDIKLLTGALWQLESGGKFPACFDMEKLSEAIRARHGDKVCLVNNPSVDRAETYFVSAAGYKALYCPYYELRTILNQCPAITSQNNALPTISARMEHLTSVPSDIAGKLRKAIEVTKGLRPPGIKIKVVRPRHKTERIALAVADFESKEVLIQADHINSASLKTLVNTLVEEYMHFNSGASDGSIEFEKALISQISSMLIEETKTSGQTF